MNQPLLDAKQIDKDPDIVQLVLNACLAHGFPEEKAQQIRKEICQKYGGRRIYVPKRSQHLSVDAKRQLAADLKRHPVKEVLLHSPVAKTTVYRIMKAQQ